MSGPARRAGFPAALLLSGLYAVSCPNGNTVEGALSFTTPASFREMITVTQGENVAIQGGGTGGAFIAGRALTLPPFSVARYETTWELWEEVSAWAGRHGYTIANYGDTNYGGQGGGGEERRAQPVTDITWRDVVVWCNAYSEAAGLEPVYYTAEGSAVLRSSVNNGPEDPSSIDSAADRALMRRDKRGFRLPLEAEWEFAARGALPEAADWNFAYAGSPAVGEVAWYDENAPPSGGPRRVGTKTGGPYRGANRLGLFDMSGNAAEWCWDWYHEDGIGPSTPPEGGGPGTFAHRVTRGGSWRQGASSCAVTNRDYCRPFSRGSYLGFRVARTE